MNEKYLAGLIERGTEAANEIDHAFEATHPGGTLEGEVLREMVRVLKGLI